MTIETKRDETLVGITPARLRALEACADAVREYKEINDRWNNTDWSNENEYNRQYAKIARRMYEALARLDALR